MISGRRKHQRFSVQFPVTFTGETVAGQGSALNLSREGCMIESDSQLEEGAYLAVSIHFQQVLLPLQIELAAVRWVNGRVFGLEFRYMQPDQYESLERILSTLEIEPTS